MKNSIQLKFIASIVFGLVCIIACSNSNEDKDESKEVVKERTDRVYFDVPSLIGKDIDEITKKLGTPKNQFSPNSEQISMGVTEADKEYSMNDANLMITYNVENKKVKEFFISLSNSEGYTDDKEYLLYVGKLKENDISYKTEFIQVLSPKLNPNRDKYTGVVITPK